jgi:chemotaxis protein methyltransferase CheR
MIPALEKTKGNLQNVKIWSSACSTGEEPYTLVMILSKYMPLSKIRILATDIDMDAIEKAKQGIYPERSLKDLPAEFLRKYFEKIGDSSYKIMDELKSCVDFSQLNLLKYDYPQNMDLIVCRNVLIYFTEEAKANIYKAFNQSLVHGGILFLGSTEQIIGSVKYGFKPIQTFFYQKVENAK